VVSEASRVLRGGRGFQREQLAHARVGVRLIRAPSNEVVEDGGGVRAVFEESDGARSKRLREAHGLAPA